MEKLETVDAWICLAESCQADPAASRYQPRRWAPSTNRARKLAIMVCALAALLLVFAVLDPLLFSASRQAAGMSVDVKAGRLPLYIIEAAYPFWRKNIVPPEEIPFDLIHEISHDFVLPGANGALYVPDGFAMPELIEMAHAANRKVNLGVGGANCYDEFATMAADPQDRSTFVQALIGFAVQNGYDGIEIDWEFPKDSDDRRNLTDFIKELRYGIQKTGRTIQLTLVVSKNDWYGTWIDVEGISPFVDYFLVMTFNYHGPTSPYSGHNTPMYPPAFEPDLMGVDGGIAYWAGTRGISPEKIIMGLAAFGVAFDSETLYAPFDQSEQSDYGSIQALTGKGYSRGWDEVSLVPYLTQDNGPWLWSYDDVESIGLKCDFAIQKGLRGVALWDLTGDLNDSQHDLLEVVAQRLETAYHYLPYIFKSPE